MNAPFLDPLAGLDLTQAAGVVKTICTVEVLGVVEAADLAAALKRSSGADKEISEVVPRVDDPSDLSKIREKHHSVARLMASGMTQRMVAVLAGYTESYVSILLDNPSMRELVELYRVKYSSGAEVIAERLRRLGSMAVERLEAQLDDPNSELDAFALTNIAKLGLDRSGHGPTSTQHVVAEQHIFDHAALQQRNRAARSASASRIIDSPTQPQLSAPNEGDLNGKDS